LTLPQKRAVVCVGGGDRARRAERTASPSGLDAARAGWWQGLTLAKQLGERRRIQASSSPVESLSGGRRQSVAVARAAAFGSRVLIMDEPTAALGVTTAPPCGRSTPHHGTAAPVQELLAARVEFGSTDVGGTPGCGSRASWPPATDDTNERTPSFSTNDTEPNPGGPSA
jgi:hypothetical protein